MDKKWEKIGRVTRSRWDHRHVSLNAKGELVINNAVFTELGSPPAVDLLYDWGSRTIGVIAVTEPTKDSYPIGPRGDTAKVIRAHRLLQRCQIAMPHSLRFTAPEIDDEGILNLDLSRTAPLQPSRAC